MSANTKAFFSRAEIELTQRLQLHFPSGLPTELVQRWNGASAEEIRRLLLGALSMAPASDWLRPHSSVTLPQFEGVFDPSRIGGLVNSLRITDLTGGFFSAFAGRGGKFCSVTQLWCDEAKEETSRVLLPQRLGAATGLAVQPYALFMLIRQGHHKADTYIYVFDVDDCPRLLHVKKNEDGTVIKIAGPHAKIGVGSLFFYRPFPQAN